MDEATAILMKATQDFISPKATENKAEEPDEREPAEEIIPESADVSMEDDNRDVVAEDLNMEPKDGISPNVSGSSDLVSGTPQKPSSRRQSFITLEKYIEGRPASPISVTKFTGPLNKTSNSQQPSTSSASQASQAESGADSQVSLGKSSETGETNLQCPITKAAEISQLGKVEPSEVKCVPEANLTEKRSTEGTEDEDDIILDTQTVVEDKEKAKEAPVVEDTESNSQGEESESNLEDSLCSPSQASQVEPRRSGRRRIRPLRPGEEPEEEEKEKLRKNSQLGEENKDASLNDTQAQGRATRRTRQAAEVLEDDGSRNKLRTRAQRDKSESSQTNSQTNSGVGGHRKIKLYSGLEDLLVKYEHKRRGAREDELSQTDSQKNAPSDTDSQSQGRLSRRSKTAVETEEESRPKRRSRSQKDEEASSQINSQGATHSQPQRRSQGMASRRSTVLSDSEEIEIVEQNKKPSQRDSQTTTPSAQTGSQSQGITSKRSKLLGESEKLNKDKQKRRDGTDDELSQDDSQMLTPPAADSQPHGRSSRRNKMSTKAVESEDKSETESVERENSQTVSQPQGKPAKNKVEGELSKSANSPSLTNVGRNEISQSLDVSGSAESSQRRYRYSSRRSSQGLLSNMENSESEASETREDVLPVKRRGRKPKSASLPSPLTLGSGEPKVELKDIVMGSSESSQKEDPESTPTNSVLETKSLQDPEESLKSQGLLVSRPPLVTKNVMEQSEAEKQMEVGVVEAVEPVILEKAETENTKPFVLVEPDQELKSKHLGTSPRKRGRGQRHSKAKLTNPDNTSSQECDIGESQVPDNLESDGTSGGQLQDELPSDLPAPLTEGNSTSDNTVLMEPVTLSSPPVPSGSSADTQTSSGETTEKLSLLVSESSEEKVLEVPQSVEVVTLEQDVKPDGDHPEPSNVLVEDEADEGAMSTSTGQDQPECPNALNESPEEQFTSIKEDQPNCQDTRRTVEEMEVQGDIDIAPLQERAESDNAPERQCEEEEEDTQIGNNDLDLVGVGSVTSLPDVFDAPVPLETTPKEVCQDSPAKQKGQDAVTGPEVGQSPSSRSKGTWSPSASPSTSILKKGQKRPLEEETPPPLVKVNVNASVENYLSEMHFKSVHYTIQIRI